MKKSKKPFTQTKNLFGFESKEEKDKFENSMSIIDDLRFSAFVPISQVTNSSLIGKEFRENGNKLIKNTPWGKVEIRTRLLTQKHFLVFLAIMATKVKVKKVDENQAVIYFTFRKIAEALSLSWSGRTQKYISEKIKEIADVQIYRFGTTGKKQTNYSILSNFDSAEDEEKGINFSKKENLYCVTIRGNYYKIFSENLTIDFKERLKEIASIRGNNASLIQAIIQHFITHQIVDGNFQRLSLEKMLVTLGFKSERKAITAINQNSEILNSFGITFFKKERSFEYRGTDKINFTPPLTGLLS